MELVTWRCRSPRYGSDIGRACWPKPQPGLDHRQIERARPWPIDEALDSLIRASDGVMVARGDWA